MINDALTFARWVDEFEQQNPGKKFATHEEAYLFYCDRESKQSETDKATQSRNDNNGFSKLSINNFDLSTEVINKAMTDPKGEFFYVAYAPLPDGSCLTDLGLKNTGFLEEVLKIYALTQNQAQAVTQFTKMVSGILYRANHYIINENIRRAKNN
jgi:hypothetical protein